MKYIKSFEAVIKPLDINLSVLKNKKFKTIDEVNKLIESQGIKFMDIREYTDSLRTQEEKSMVPTIPMTPAMRFAACNPATKILAVVYTSDYAILQELNSDRFLEFFNRRY